MTHPQSGRGADRQPIFNLPRVMTGLLVGLLAIHLIRTLLLTDAQDAWVIVNFAFYPAAPIVPGIETLSGARIWSFATYGALHADWTHLIVNGVWMAAFGSPLAWRFGAGRFLAFSLVAVVAGALTHLLAHGGEAIPLVGASAAVSAHMAGVARFLFVGGAPKSYRSPAASLGAMLSDARTLMFLGVWIVVNLAVGLFGAFSLEAGRIAWEAHVGGFVVGLLLFPLFDPVPRSGRNEDIAA